MAEDKDKIWTVVPDSDVPARRPGSVGVKRFTLGTKCEVTIVKLQTYFIR